MVADVVGFIRFMHGSEMLQPDRACATGARKHAVGNLISPFVFNYNFGQITVEYFAAATVRGRMNHRGVDKGVFPVAFHTDGDSGNLKNITIPEERTVPGFTNAEAYFGKTHQ
jgi:hypothetical protein